MILFLLTTLTLLSGSTRAWSPASESVQKQLRERISNTHDRRKLVAISSCVHNDVGLSFVDATLVHNNLGGEGPDGGDEIMKLANVGTYNGLDLDLVISIKEGSNYQVANNANNGMICGPTDGNPDTRSCDTGADFGQINMLRNRDATLIFEIQDQATGNPVILPAFVFSAFDIDEGVREHYLVKGWSSAQYDHDNTEAFFTETDEEFCGDAMANGETCLYAHSTSQGHGCDNPHSAFDLGVVKCKDNNMVDQKARSFQVTFENRSSFEMYFWYEANEGTNGRNVVFAFNSALSEDCTLPPTVSPTNAPTLAPTTLEYARLQADIRSANLNLVEDECPDTEDL